MVSAEFPSVAARSLNDISIPEDVSRIDNDLAKRSDETAMDLAKWALLGIAGYGFLLKEMAVPSGGGLFACERYATVLILGAGLFAAAAAFALGSKERLIRCAVYQMYILRSLKKLENGGWSEQQATALRADLAGYRDGQKKNIVIAARWLRLAHGCLAAGAIVTVVCFGLVLFSMRAAGS